MHLADIWMYLDDINLGKMSICTKRAKWKPKDIKEGMLRNPPQFMCTFKTTFKILPQIPSTYGPVPLRYRCLAILVTSQVKHEGLFKKYLKLSPK